MKNKFLIASTGFALFSMFFGSGNLVVPLEVGQLSQGHFIAASFGLFLTAVIVPFMGVMGMMLFKGDSESFFGSMGKTCAFLLPLIILSLMGPFGVLARCITVAHGSYQLLFPETSLPLFSAVMCGFVFLFTRNRTKIVSALGSILTPFLLAALGCIALVGLFSADTVQVTAPLSSSTIVAEGAWSAFKQGFFKGYQIMDLLAAFFFSAFVLKHLAERCKEGFSEQEKMGVFLKSTFIGSFLLSLVYFALVYLGALYAPQLAAVPPQQMLGVVAQHTLGSFSAPVVCVAAVLACFTTAIVLGSLFADFFRTEVTKNKVPVSVAMTLTLVTAFVVSTFEFAGIAKIIGPILELLYPALITLTIINICSKVWGVRRIRWPVALTFALKLFI